jgi:aryl-alcohol dehydrogenase-like predicted oxidoreductase
VHRPDPDTDVEGTPLTDLQRQGKIRAFGSSTFPAHQIVEAQWTAQQRALPNAYLLATTCPTRTTSASSTLPTPWPGWPNRPGCP